MKPMTNKTTKMKTTLKLQTKNNRTVFFATFIGQGCRKAAEVKCHELMLASKVQLVGKIYAA